MPCYRQVRLKDINLADRSYTLDPFPQEPEKSLLHSINSFGILQPPLLLEKQDSTFIILSGRKRLDAFIQVSNAQEGQQEKEEHLLTALILSSNEEKPENKHVLFTTLLQHQLLGGSLTVIEQAAFLQKATTILAEREVLDLLPLLGLKSKPHIPGELISLLDLEPAVQLGLHNGIIAPRSAKKISLFSADDQQQLTKLIEKYQLGGSKQQKLLERFFQLTRRKQVSVEALHTQWEEKEKDRQLNGPQRASSLLRWLDREYQPRLTQAEEEFRKFCTQLQLPAGVRVDHSLSFEEEKVTLSMEFSSKEELARSWPQMEELLRQE